MDRDHIIGHDEWQNPAWTNWMAINYPQINTTCNNHTDPGPYWNWTYFMNLISGSNGVSGTFWDATNSSGVVTGGTWDNFSTNWNPLANGSAPRGTWVGPNMAVFCAGTSFLSAYTVTISETQIVTGVLVSNGNPTFTGGGLAFEGTNAYYTNYVGAGLTATYDTTFTGTGAPDKWGPGTAVYNTAAAVLGSAYFTLNQGTIAIGNNSAFGPNHFILGDSTGANVVTLKSASTTAYVISNPVTVDATNFILDSGGGLTLSGPVNLGTVARTATVNNSSTFSGALTNSASLTKAGTGALTFSGTTTNTYGATVVSAGTLILGKANTNSAIPAAGVTINSGGTLQSAAANQINDTAPMTLAGGTWLTGGFNELLGTLKLTASSTINLGAAGVVKFAASGGVAWTGSAMLSITAWNGLANGGGLSQLFAGANSSGLTVAQLNQIQFVNPLGLSGNFAAKILSSGEVVPAFSPPSFVGQPQPQVAVAGSNVTFTATASGTSPLSYQWKFGASGIAGATNSWMTLTNVAVNQSGAYSVVVTNIAGTNASNPAQLAVYATAAATLGLSSAPVNGSFSFGVSGVPGYSYVIQSSTNLVDWVLRETNITPFIFTDTNAVNPSEFYRALYSPQ
jgi:autotransporter-associated beta strand protein